MNEAQPTTALPAVPTAGFKSSEFAATLASAVAIGSGYIPAHYIPLFTAVTGLYVACRTVLKAVHALGYAKSLPDLPSLPELPPGTTVTQSSTTQVPAK